MDPKGFDDVHVSGHSHVHNREARPSFCSVCNNVNYEWPGDKALYYGDGGHQKIWGFDDVSGYMYMYMYIKSSICLQ